MSFTGPFGAQEAPVSHWWFHDINCKSRWEWEEGEDEEKGYGSEKAAVWSRPLDQSGIEPARGLHLSPEGEASSRTEQP